MRFHLILNWLPTKEEHEELVQHKKNDDHEDVATWKPSWYPHLEFVNVVEEHSKTWELYPKLGIYRLTQLLGFGIEKMDGKKYQKIEGFNDREAYFVRAKLDCDMTFAEEFELANFPLDCQDLTCIIQERTTKDFEIKFLPELRDNNFCFVDSTYCTINDWDICNAFLTLSKSAGGRTGKQYSQIEISLKLRRS